MARTMIAVDDLTLNAGKALTSSYLTAGGTGTAGFALYGIERDSDLRLVVENAGATGALTVKANGTYVLDSEGDLAIVLGGAIR